MKIAVFGAGGRTGILLVFQALKEGHHVTAFARNANKITIRHEHLRVVEGDVMNEEKVREAVEGCDAVLCTLGADRRNPGTILSDGTRNILRAMEASGVKRFICMSSAGILGHDGGFWFGKVFVPLFLRRVFADKRRQAALIQESDMEWVILRPVGLTDSPKTGTYKINPGNPTSMTVPRADVADFMLKLVTNRKYDRTLPAISSH